MATDWRKVNESGVFTRESWIDRAETKLTWCIGGALLSATVGVGLLLVDDERLWGFSVLCGGISATLLGLGYVGVRSAKEAADDEKLDFRQHYTPEEERHSN